MKKWFIIFTLSLWGSALFAAINPLPAHQVFHTQVKLIDPNNFAITWTLKEGYFLYADRFQIQADNNHNMTIGSLRFPPALKKVDRLGHMNRIYRHELSLPVPVLGQHPGSTSLTIHYQGCSDEGFCYPPETQKIQIQIDDQLALSDVRLSEQSNPSQINKSMNQADDIESLFNSAYWYVILLTFFGLGLLLAFTPCVLPMVPVLSGIIVGHGAISTKKAFGLSLSYVFSMACTYALLGVIVAQLGKNLQIAMQSPLVIILFSCLFVLLALSMFGLYDLKLPLSWQAKLAQYNRTQSTGHYLGAAIMGSLSSLVLSPCVTPPLVGALSYIAKTENVLLGAAALFSLGFGMGTPLLFIGVSAGKWLPKAGLWMNAVKSFFGFLLLGMAIYLLDRITPPSIIMALSGILLIIAGIYSDAFTIGHTHREKLKQALAIILLVYGLVLLIGASMGSSNFMQPLAGAFAPANAPVENNQHMIVTTPEALNTVMNQSKDKPIVLDYYADWCTSCKILEKTVLTDPLVQKALERFVIIKVDITKNTANQQALLNEYQVIAPPTFIFLNTEHQEVPNSRLVGEISSEELINQLEAF